MKSKERNIKCNCRSGWSHKAYSTSFKGWCTCSHLVIFSYYFKCFSIIDNAYWEALGKDQQHHGCVLFLVHMHRFSDLSALFIKLMPISQFSHHMLICSHYSKNTASFTKIVMQRSMTRYL